MQCGTDIDVQIIPQGINVVVNNKEQRLTSPLFSAFNDIYDKMTQEMTLLRMDIREQGERIKRINTELLNKLRI